MRSSNLPAAALALALVFLSGCSRPLDVNAPNVRGIGYVRLAEVVKAHPLYSQLSQINDDIAALRLQPIAPSLPKTGAEIAAQSKQLDRELKAAQDRATAILQSKEQTYSSREQAAIHAALVAAGEAGAGAQSARSMQTVTAQQAGEVTAQANRDFEAYQQSVIAQDQAAVTAIGHQLSVEADRKYRLRAQQLQEKESQLSLELSQRDAAERLDLRTKLSNLVLDSATRKKYQSELAALDRKESAVLDAQRVSDQRVLAAYRQRLQGETQAAIARQASAIHAQTRAKIAARRSEVGAKIASRIQGLAPQPLPSDLPAAMRAKIAQIDQMFKTKFQADAQKTITDYETTKADLDARYAALHGVTGGISGAAAAQIYQLNQQRAKLYAQIVAQVRRDAARVAAARGLKVVFVNVEAAPGGVDLTGAVKKDIESVHQ